MSRSKKEIDNIKALADSLSQRIGNNEKDVVVRVKNYKAGKDEHNKKQPLESIQLNFKSEEQRDRFRVIIKVFDKPPVSMIKDLGETINGSFPTVVLDPRLFKIENINYIVTCMNKRERIEDYINRYIQKQNDLGSKLDSSQFHINRKIKMAEEILLLCRKEKIYGNSCSELFKKEFSRTIKEMSNNREEAQQIAELFVTQNKPIIPKAILDEKEKIKDLAIKFAFRIGTNENAVLLRVKDFEPGDDIHNQQQPLESIQLIFRTEEERDRLRIIIKEYDKPPESMIKYSGYTNNNIPMIQLDPRFFKSVDIAAIIDKVADRMKKPETREDYIKRYIQSEYDEGSYDGRIGQHKWFIARAEDILSKLKYEKLSDQICSEEFKQELNATFKRMDSNKSKVNDFADYFISIYKPKTPDEIGVEKENFKKIASEFANSIGNNEKNAVVLKVKDYRSGKDEHNKKQPLESIQLNFKTEEQRDRFRVIINNYDVPQGSIIKYSGKTKSGGLPIVELDPIFFKIADITNVTDRMNKPETKRDYIQRYMQLNQDLYKSSKGMNIYNLRMQKASQILLKLDAKIEKESCTDDFKKVFNNIIDKDINLYAKKESKPKYKHHTESQNAGRWHIFESMGEKISKSNDNYKNEYKQIKGDYLKSKILSKFYNELQKADTEEAVDKIVNNYKADGSYKTLTTGQGIATYLFNRETKSKKAFDEIIEDRLKEIKEIKEIEEESSKLGIKNN